MGSRAARVAWITAMAVLLAGCATNSSKGLPSNSGTAEPTELYFIVNDREPTPKIDGICVFGYGPDQSDYQRCPSKSAVELQRDGFIYASVETLLPSAAAPMKSCEPTREEGSRCDNIYSAAPVALANPINMIMTAVSTVALSPIVPAKLSEEKLAAFIEKQYPATMRQNIVSRELLKRKQARARTLAWAADAPAREKRHQEEARKAEQQRLQAQAQQERQRQQRIAEGRAVFEQRAREPRRVGWPVCTKSRGYGYVERIEGQRLLVSIKDIVEPRRLEEYELFRGSLRRISTQDRETRWVNASDWARCTFD